MNEPISVVRKQLDASITSHLNTAMELAKVQVLLDLANQQLGKMKYLEEENARLNIMLQQIRQHNIIKYGIDPLVKG